MGTGPRLAQTWNLGSRDKDEDPDEDEDLTALWSSGSHSSSLFGRKPSGILPFPLSSVWISTVVAVRLVRLPRFSLFPLRPQWTDLWVPVGFVSRKLLEVGAATRAAEEVQ